MDLIQQPTTQNLEHCDHLLQALESQVAAGDATVEPGIWEGLIRIGEPVVGPLSTLLWHDRQEVVRAAAEALLQIGGSVCQVLQTALIESGIQHRPAIIRGFGSHPEPWMVAPLCRLLGDPDSEVDFAASCALQELDAETLQTGTAAAEARTLVPVLCRLILENAELPSPQSNSSLPGSALPEPAITSRGIAAATVLYQFSWDVIRAEMEGEVNPELCQRLISALGCERLSVADAALRVLWGLHDLAAGPILEAFQNGRHRAPGVEGLTEIQAIALVRLIALCGDPRAIEVLCESVTQLPLRFSGSSITMEVIQALGQMRDARAVPALSELLTSPVQTNRLWAAQALGKIGHPSALPALRRLVSLLPTWGEPVVWGNWLDRLLTTQVLTFDTDAEVREAVKQAIALIEQSANEGANFPIPSRPDSGHEDSILPRPAE